LEPSRTICVLRRLALFAAAHLLADPVVSLAADSGNVAVEYRQAASYRAGATGGADRAEVARQLFSNHGDHYDFIIAFPTFSADFGTGDALGLHTPVRNDVSGIGHPQYDAGVQFGSSGRLKAYVDIGELRPGSSGNVSGALGIIAHEIAHQWSGKVSYLDGFASMSSDLRGRDDAHWSFFLDSDASVLYGAAWQPDLEGTFTATERVSRYSPLDLYLMGFLPASQVPPMTLLRPAAETPFGAEDVPPAPGTVIAAVPELVSIEQIVAAEGARYPDASRAQRIFRAAFVIVADPAHPPTAEQVAWVDTVRREWANQFFFLTRGLAVMETDLVERPAGEASGTPSTDAALAYLLSRQEASGAWADHDSTRVRETAAAIESLSLFAGEEVAAARERGGAYLEAVAPGDVDAAARRVLGVLAARAPASFAVADLDGLASSSSGGGTGLSRGYGATVIDSALAALARASSGHAAGSLHGFLLESQNADGGWGFTPGGPSRIEPTVRVLEYLARERESYDVAEAAERGIAFLQSRRESGGLFLDDAAPAVASSALAMLVLTEWNRLDAGEAKALAGALLALQSPDGSWSGSVHQTAQALKALARLSAPNLSIWAPECAVATTMATEGETTVLTATVRNTGYEDARDVLVQAFDSSGVPFGPGQVVPVIEAGQQSVVKLSLDTLGHVSSTQVFVVVDPGAAVVETQETDNRVALAFSVVERPVAADLFVASGTLTFEPAGITRLPATVTVSAIVGNAGRTGAQGVEVALRVDGTTVATAVIDLPQGDAKQVTLTAVIGTIQSSLATASVVIDPLDRIPESREENNRAHAVIPLVPVVDLVVENLRAAPSTVGIGGDVEVTYSVRQAGTVSAGTAAVSAKVVDASGATLATLPAPGVAPVPGASSDTRIVWRASSADAAAIVVEVAHPSDADPGNNRASAVVSVEPSGLPNLGFRAPALAVAPDPPLEGQTTIFTARVANEGTARAGQFFVDLYLGDPSRGAPRIGRREVAGLDPDQTTDLVFEHTLSSPASVPLVCVLDSDHQVQEYDERDNQELLEITPRALPDLVVSEADIQPSPPSPQPEEDVSVVVSVVNAGGRPSTACTLELWAGAPGTGELIERADVPALGLEERFSATFSWRTGTASGSQVLTAVLNPERAGSESRFDNNVAMRQVLVQDARLALSRPYFSPNGDGVMDETQIAWRQDMAPIAISIADKRGDVVRRMAISQGPSGATRWDGRDGAGRVVRDGTYVVSVVGPEGLPAGRVPVVVDTNRASVLDPESRDLLDPVDVEAMLAARLGTGALDLGMSAVALPGGGGLVVREEHYTSEASCGIYLVDLNGGDIQRLDGGLDCGTVSALQPSPDGLALYAMAGSPPQLVRLDLATQGVDVIAEAGLPEALPFGYFTLHPDGRTAFTWEPERILSVDLTTGTTSVIAERTFDVPRLGQRMFNKPLLSPDGQRIAFIGPCNGLHVMEASGWGDRLIAAPPPEMTEIHEICDPVAGVAGPGSDPAAPYHLVPPGGIYSFVWAGPNTVVASSAEGLIAVDAEQGTAELVAPPELGVLDFAADLSGEPLAFIYTPSAGSAQIWTASLSDGTSSFFSTWPVAPRQFQGLYDLQLSPEGSVLLADVETSTLYGGDWDLRWRALVTLGNLGVRLAVARPPASRGLVLTGTVADLHLDSWELSIRRVGGSEPARILARSTKTVIGGVLAEWAPPAPGLYEALLTARDRAGNVRKRSLRVGWDDLYALSDLRRDLEFFSPNGDGRQDEVQFTYTVSSPISTAMVVRDAQGGVVRSVPLVHASPGEYGIAWDGRREDGQTALDGTYSIEIGALATTVILDATAPQLEIALAAGGEEIAVARAKAGGYLYLCDGSPSMEAREIATAALPVTWQATDDNLEQWVVESAERPESTRFEEVRAGTTQEEQQEQLLVRALEGPALRIRASDRAGNVAVSEVVAPPERLLPFGYGPGHTVGACIGGRIVVPALGSSWPAGAERYQGLRWGEPGPFLITDDATNKVFGFTIESTIRVPIASYAIAYRPFGTETPLTYDRAVVADGDVAIRWDARQLPPGEYEVWIVAYDVTGRAFHSTGQWGGEQGSGSGACVLANGEVAASSPRHPGYVMVAEADTRKIVLQVRDDGGPAHDIVLPTASLPGCKYVVGRPDDSRLAELTKDGKLDPSVTGNTVDLCTTYVAESRVEGRTALLTLGETHRSSISRVDVFLRSEGGLRFKATSVPRFEGRSGLVAVPIDPSLGCARFTVSTVTHLGTGEVRESAASSPETCGAVQTAAVTVGCTEIVLGAPVRDGPSPACTPYVASYRVPVRAQSVDSEITSVSARIRPINGAPVAPLAVDAFTPGPVITTSAPVTGAALPEGTWLVSATATDGNGAVANATPVQVIVDRTPPVIALQEPAAGAKLCSEKVVLPDGSFGEVLRVVGAIADDHLERYSVRFACGDGPPAPVLEQPRSPAARTALEGELGVIDVSAISSSDCRLFLEAADASGGSICTPPAEFRLVRGARLSGTVVEPSIFAPDGHGAATSTALAYVLDEDAHVRITARDAQGGGAVLAEMEAPVGRQAFTWTGNFGPGAAPDGDYTLEVHATSACGHESRAVATATVDATPPTARLDTPADGDRIVSSLTVTGVATDAHFLDYRIEIGKGLSPSTFNLLSSSTHPAEGVLATSGLAGYEPGPYTVRLTARDRAGHSSVVEKAFTVAPGQLIEALAVAAPRVSPNADGRRDTTNVTFRLAGDATVSLDLVDDAGVVVAALGAPFPALAGETAVTLPEAILAAASDGRYGVRLEADVAGISEVQEIPLDIDRIAPVLAIDAPAEDEHIRSDAVVRGKVDERVGLESWVLSRSDPDAPSAVAVAGGDAPMEGVLGQLQALGEGEHTLRLVAADAAGNASEMVRHFVVDASAPKVAFLSPTNTEWTRAVGGEVLISAIVEDGHLASVSLVAETGSGKETINEGQTWPGSVAWHPVADGPATLVLEAVDRAGNRASARIQIQVDRTPPVASIAEPRDTFLARSASITGTALDANLSSWSIEMALGPAAATSVYLPIASGTEAVEGSELASLASLPADGAYALRLVVRDLAGNTSEDQTSFSVDTTPPAAPVALVGTTTGRDIALTWSAPAGEPAVGYRVYRALGDGQEHAINESLVTAPSSLDAGVPDGTYRYVVTALDAAGNESARSGAETIKVDATAPLVAIVRPAAGARVSGIIPVVGTAKGIEDLSEYRLSYRLGGSTGPEFLIRSSGIEVVGSELGELDATLLPDGTTVLLRLEAEDVSGNVAATEATVTVDDTAPAPPVLVAADVTGNRVDLSWEANAEADLAGYLVYRDGVLANAPPGAPVADLRAFAVSREWTSYADGGVPDGSHAYQLQAIDEAGNLSGSSNAVSAVVEARAPSAQIVTPAALARVAGVIDVAAETPDQDIATMRFEVRAGTGELTEVASLSGPPWAIKLDTAQYEGQVLELRAIAFDRAGQADPKPTSTYVFAESALLPPELTTHVDGSTASISWTDENAAGRVAGWSVARDGVTILPAPTRPTGTAAATDTSTAAASAGYDGSSSTSWRTSLPLPQSWEVALATPTVVDLVQVKLYQMAEIALRAKVRGVWVLLAQRSAGGTVSVPLQPPLEIDGLKVDLISAPGTIVGVYEATLRSVALAKSPPVSDGNLSLGSHEYRVGAMTPFGQAAFGEASATVFRPTLAPLPASVPSQLLRVTGGGVPPGSSVSLLLGSTLQAQAVAGADGAFEGLVPLAVGANTITALVTDPAGNRSLPAVSGSVSFAPPPAATVALTLTSVSGSEVSLAFDVAGDTSAVAGFHVLRSRDGGPSSAIANLSASARSWADVGVADGAYEYRVVSFNAKGFDGAPSNPVTAMVATPDLPAPTDLTVQALAGGGALRLAWSGSGSHFMVERSLSEVGPFELIGSTEPGFPAVYVDRGLTDGVTYHYRVRALDGASNAGAVSDVASGVPADTFAPGAPRLTSPVESGRSWIAWVPVVDVRGLAEPGSEVELRLNGRYAGRAIAGPLELRQAYIGQSRKLYAISPDGRYQLTNLRSYSLGEYLWLAEKRLSFSNQSINSYTRAAFSPDGSQFIAETIDWSDGLAHLWLGQSSGGSLQRLLTSSTGAESDPAWSPDARSLAYECKPTAQATAVLCILDLATGSERRLSPPAGYQVRHPLWLVGGGVAVLLVPTTSGPATRLAVADLATGTFTPVFEGVEPGSGYSLSPDGERVAIVRSDASRDLVQVNLASGTPELLTSDPVAQSLPVYSPDGQRILFRHGGTIAVHDLSTGLTEVLGPIADQQVVLAWTASCAVLAAISGSATGSAYALDWGGSFEIPRVALSSGRNALVASAVDPAGNAGPASEPGLLDLDGSNFADLEVVAAVQPAVPVAGEVANAVVTVRNAGGSDAAAAELSVTLLASDGSTRTAGSVLLAGLAPGQSTAAAFPLDLRGLEGVQTLVAVADPSGLVADVDRTNNEARVGFRVADSHALDLSVAVTPQEVGVNGALTATVAVTNPGAPRTATIEIRLADLNGATVSMAPPVADAPLPGGATTTIVRTIQVGTTFAGGYQVIAEVVEAGAVLARAVVPVTVEAERSTVLALQAQRASYYGGETLAFQGRVTNHSLNATLAGADYRLELLDLAGQVACAAPAQEVPALWLGLSGTIETTLACGSLAPGIYQARARVSLGGEVLAEAQATVTVVGRPQLVGAISVAGEGDPPMVRSGSPVPVSLEVRNTGSAAASTRQLTLSAVDRAGVTIWTTVIPVAELPEAALVRRAVDLPTAGLSLDVFGLSLAAEHADGRVELLATSRFRVGDGQVPWLEVQNLRDGMFVAGAVTAQVHGRDDASGVAMVGVRVDGAERDPLALVSGVSLDGNWSGTFPLLADGEHEVLFWAVDAEGNDGRATPAPSNPVALRLVSDTVPPVVSIEGAVDGSLHAAPVSPVVVAQDLNLAGVAAEADGVELVAGMAIAEDGDHLVTARAWDRAGNTAQGALRFTIDRTPPAVTLFGVGDGEYVSRDVTPTVQVTDRHLAGYDALIDGGPLLPGMTVSEERTYLLSVRAHDLAGNTADEELHFTIDKTPPAVELSGFEDGAEGKDPVAVVYSVSDANLLQVDATIDGVPFVSGTAISAEGTHAVRVVGHDRAGNRSTRTGAFTIDRTAPVIQLGGVDRQYTNAAAVIPVFTATDAGLASVSAALDGEPFVSGTPMTAEGAHTLVVTAADHAGNQATRTVEFTLDRTPPEVTLSGVDPDVYAAGPVALAVSASDANPGTTEVTLDGEPYQPGVPIAVEGAHFVRAIATDLAGNAGSATLQFTIDSTIPEIVVAGVTDGEVTAADIVPVVMVSDANLAGYDVTVDGAQLPMGGAVTSEGEHVLEVTAHDLAGNVATARLSFEIDRTPPAIQTSVAQGGSYAPPLAITFEAIDAHLVRVSASLDGQPFQNGGLVESAGSHLLVVEAEDAAGNLSTETVSFSVTRGTTTDLQLVKSLVRIPRVLAWIANGCRRDRAAEQLKQFVSEAAGADAIVAFARDDGEFRRLLRTGIYDVYLLGVVGEGDQDLWHEWHIDVAGSNESWSRCSSSNCSRLSSQTEAELTEAVFRGAGLVVVKDGASENPELREALGVHFRGAQGKGAVYLSDSAFSTAGTLEADRGLRLDPEGALPVGVLRGKPVLTAHAFGLGEAITFGFDPSTAYPSSDAAALLGKALVFATSDTVAEPLGVLAVKIDLENRGDALDYRIVERLDPGLAVVEVLDGGKAEGTSEVEWLGRLETTGEDALRYLVRLPAVAGSYQTTAELSVIGPDGIDVYGIYPLTLDLSEGRQELHDMAVAAARGLRNRGSTGMVRRRVLALLSQVAINPGLTTADQERAIDDLLEAVRHVRSLHSDNTGLRYALDRLLGYWEAQR
jgi:subtilase family serine protease/flagellar hook assembly protein FlgD